MRRRSRAGGEPVNTRRRKAPKTRRRNPPKAVAGSNSSFTAEETEVARLTRELNEARDQQAATSEVLAVINSSSGDLERVFQSMLANATRICEAKFGVFYLYGAAGFEPAALSNGRGHCRSAAKIGHATRRTPHRPVAR